MRWPPYKHVFFDCDSTLTTVEGIDVLAENAGKGPAIKQLTDAAMNGEIDLADVYGQRLQTIKPTRLQVAAIRDVYKKHLVPDAATLIAALKHLGHNIYIISGGLYEPVKELGISLGVPANHIRAVGLQYNELTGEWWLDDAEHHPLAHPEYLTYGAGALTVSDGKAQMVRELLGDGAGRALLVGDGTSDLLAFPAVDLFVGYGGVVTRDRVAAEAPVFIHSDSLAPLLLLAAGPAAWRQLADTPYADLAQTAATLYEQGAITFTHEQLRTKFEAAYQTVRPRPG